MIGKCLITTGDKVIGTVIIVRGLYSQLKEMLTFSLQLEKIEMSFFFSAKFTDSPWIAWEGKNSRLENWNFRILMGDTVEETNSFCR